jgi:hypothetical protein
MHPGEYSSIGICLLFSIHQGNTASFVFYCLYSQGNAASFVCYFPLSVWKITDKCQWSCIPLGVWKITNKWSCITLGVLKITEKGSCIPLGA